MKYEFVEKETDLFELVYTNKKNEEVKLGFKRDLNIVKKLQRINVKAKLLLAKELKDAGLTKDDLITKRVENGKTIYDESEYKELETSCNELAYAEMTDEIISELFNKGMLELFTDMNLDEKAMETFITELFTILTTTNSGDEEQFPRGNIK